VLTSALAFHRLQMLQGLVEMQWLIYGAKKIWIVICVLSMVTLSGSKINGQFSFCFGGSPHADLSPHAFLLHLFCSTKTKGTETYIFDNERNTTRLKEMKTSLKELNLWGANRPDWVFMDSEIETEYKQIAQKKTTTLKDYMSGDFAFYKDCPHEDLVPLLYQLMGQKWSWEYKMPLLFDAHSKEFAPRSIMGRMCRVTVNCAMPLRGGAPDDNNGQESSNRTARLIPAVVEKGECSSLLLDGVLLTNQ
jgi:hypothetical protein